MTSKSPNKTRLSHTPSTQNMPGKHAKLEWYGLKLFRGFLAIGAFAVLDLFEHATMAR